MAVHIHNSGQWKQVQQIFVRSAGVWESANDAHIRHSGAWKSVLYEPGSQAFTSAGSNTFVVPAGVISLTAEVVGGGGGGGGCHSSGDVWVGGGGGAGGHSVATSYTVTPGESLTVNVGDGGCRGSTHFNGWLYLGCRGTQDSHGDDGEDSYIARGSTDVIRAQGGEGGPQGLGTAFASPRGSWGSGAGCVSAAGGTPLSNSAGTAAGQQNANTGCYGYGHNGPQYGGVNGSSNNARGSGGNGGASANAGVDGGVGYINLVW